MADDTYYRALGVDRSATPDEIQRAYRTLARSWHPDVNKAPEAEDRFKVISEAYDVLSDPDRRKRYDAFGDDFRKVPDDVDPDDWARAQAGGRPRSGRGGDVFVDYGDMGGPMGGSFEDLLGGMFGQGRQSAGPRPGPDQEVEIELSVIDAYRGGEQRITLTGAEGSKSYTVKIPKGVIDGQRIRLPGQGAAGRGGGPAGDLFLTVRLRSDARFRVSGRSVSVDLPISPWEAALGATVAVDTPDGETKVKVPPATSSGQKLRLRGRGMANASGLDGDLFAVVKIVVPKNLSERETELFDELAAVSTFDPRSGR